jgi:hypothetical protein
MLIEVSILQRLIVFLGHAIYSLSVILVIAMALGIAASFWSGVASYLVALGSFAIAARLRTG